jgi:hypothetical protein
MNLKLRLLLCIFSASIAVGTVFADEKDKKDAQKTAETDKASDAAANKKPDDDCCDDIDNSLKVKILCAHRVRTKILDARCVEAEKINVEHEFCTHTIKSKSACTEHLGVNKTACINTLTANDAQATTLCVTSQARINEICGIYRALVDFSADQSYNLGDNVNFNNVIDDPNNNVSLAPFFYTVPVSGYYIATLQVDQVNLVATDPILGVPTAHLQLFVNGLLSRDATTPFLTFSNQQKSNISSILKLNAGDIVQAQYSVDSLSNAGLATVTGSVTIQGGLDKTLFGIHYLSSDCTPAACTPRECTPCDTSCHHHPCPPCAIK